MELPSLTQSLNSYSKISLSHRLSPRRIPSNILPLLHYIPRFASACFPYMLFNMLAKFSSEMGLRWFYWRDWVCQRRASKLHTNTITFGNGVLHCFDVILRIRCINEVENLFSETAFSYVKSDKTKSKRKCNCMRQFGSHSTLFPICIFACCRARRKTRLTPFVPCLHTHLAQRDTERANIPAPIIVHTVAISPLHNQHTAACLPTKPSTSAPPTTTQHHHSTRGPFARPTQS